jgi:hypothetical protein
LRYDVTIVGCGPAGIFSALELSKNKDLNILMIDKGKDIEKRKCFDLSKGSCVSCIPCSLLCGWGGAGAFSDGKLTLTSEVGGWLSDYREKRELEKLVEEVDKYYVEFGAPSKVIGGEIEEIERLKKRANLYGVELIPYKVRHIGSENCKRVLARMKDFLSDKVEIMLDKEVKKVIVKEGKVQGIECGEKIDSRYVILAPGRGGASWLRSEAKKLGIRTQNNPVDIGVRLETKAEVLQPLTQVLYDPKLVYHSKSFDDKVRTFCVAPHGVVVLESYQDVKTVNGESFANRKSENTNLALLVSTQFTQPFKEPIAYGKYLARLANMLSGDSVLVQRLVDLKSGRRSTKERLRRSIVKPTLSSAVPGDIAFALPYRILGSIVEMIEKLDKLAPGIDSEHTLLYGVEVKFYSSRLDLSKELEVKNIKNLFAIGDGAGITRSLMQASISGIIAGREILRRG